MSMFSDQEWNSIPQAVEAAPGPAAYSANGNGPDHEPAEVTGVPRDPLVWIAEAPPAAIFATAAAGALLALIFLAIGRMVKQ